MIPSPRDPVLTQVYQGVLAKFRVWTVTTGPDLPTLRPSSPTSASGASRWSRSLFSQKDLRCSISGTPQVSFLHVRDRPDFVLVVVY